MESENQIEDVLSSNMMEDAEFGSLDNLLNLSPRRLEFRGIAAAVYAVVTVIKAIGLWQRKVWAGLLVIGLAGTRISLEIHELIHGITVVKTIAFVVNIFVLVYLIRMLRDREI